MKPNPIITPKPSLVRSFQARNQQLLEREFRKALNKRSPSEKLNAINVLLASALQGYVELMDLPVPADNTLVSLWRLVKRHLKLSSDGGMNCMRPAMERLTKGLTAAVDGLSMTTELNFTGTIAGASKSDHLQSGFLHIPLFGHGVFAFILLLLELHDYCSAF
jgi:hypothetical protein